MEFKKNAENLNYEHPLCKARIQPFFPFLSYLPSLYIGRNLNSDFTKLKHTAFSQKIFFDLNNELHGQ